MPEELRYSSVSAVVVPADHGYLPRVYGLPERVTAVFSAGFWADHGGYYPFVGPRLGICV